MIPWYISCVKLACSYDRHFCRSLFWSYMSSYISSKAAPVITLSTEVLQLFLRIKLHLRILHRSLISLKTLIATAVFSNVNFHFSSILSITCDYFNIFIYIFLLKNILVNRDHIKYMSDWERLVCPSIMAQIGC